MAALVAPRLWLAALLLTALAAAGGPRMAFAQGNESTSTSAQAESSQEAGEVMIGAGSTAAVTTGSSGPSQASNPPVDGLPASFSLVTPERAFGQRGELPIVRPARLRCDVIEEARAKARCEAKAKELRP